MFKWFTQEIAHNPSGFPLSINGTSDGMYLSFIHSAGAEHSQLNASIAVGIKDLAEGKYFWTAYRSWLQEYGYTIYAFSKGDARLLVPPSMTFYQARHPFAVFSSDIPSRGEFFREQVRGVVQSPPESSH